jgi:hypothetical protein
MSITMKQYKQLEARIRKTDLDVLKARWQGLKARWAFGHQLLKERGDKERLPKGRLEAIYAAVGNMRVTYDAYKMECSRRLRFAAQYPTEAKVRAAFEDYGSWSEICAWGMGEDRRAAGANARAKAEIAKDEAYSQNTVGTLLSWVDQALADARAGLLALRQHIVGRPDVREVDVRDMLTLVEQLLARYKEIQGRRWVLLGRFVGDRGLLRFVATAKKRIA